MNKKTNKPGPAMISGLRRSIREHDESRKIALQRAEQNVTDAENGARLHGHRSVGDARRDAAAHNVRCLTQMLTNTWGRDEHDEIERAIKKYSAMAGGESTNE